MQFSLYTNQAKTIEWGISLSHATLFGFIYNAATWAHKVGDYWNVSKGKILEELPILTDKIDTVYRMEKELIEKGLLEKKLIDGKDYFKVTEKGLGWNQTEPVKKVGKKSEPRKNIRSRSENNPISNGKLSDVSNNQISNNQDQIKKTCATASKTDPIADEFEQLWKIKPDRQGGNPKNTALKNYRARRKAGHSAEVIKNGLIRYTKYCAAKGDLKTEFVKMLSTFLNPDDQFLETWEIKPDASNKPSNSGSHGQKQTVAAATRDHYRRKAEKANRAADHQPEIEVS